MDCHVNGEEEGRVKGKTQVSVLMFEVEFGKNKNADVFKIQ